MDFEIVAFIANRNKMWCHTLSLCKEDIWVFPKCFHWIRSIQWLKILVFTVKEFEPVPAIRVWDMIFKLITIFMLQWFTIFPEFAECQFHLGKTPCIPVGCVPPADWLHLIVSTMGGESGWIPKAHVKHGILLIQLYLSYVDHTYIRQM